MLCSLFPGKEEHHAAQIVWKHLQHQTKIDLRYRAPSVPSSGFESVPWIVSIDRLIFYTTDGSVGVSFFLLTRSRNVFIPGPPRFGRFISAPSLNVGVLGTGFLPPQELRLSYTTAVLSALIPVITSSLPMPLPLFPSQPSMVDRRYYLSSKLLYLHH